MPICCWGAVYAIRCYTVNEVSTIIWNDNAYYGASTAQKPLGWMVCRTPNRQK